MSEPTPEEVEVPDVAEAYPDRSYRQAITPEHLHYLQENAPEQAPQ